MGEPLDISIIRTTAVGAADRVRLTQLLAGFVLWLADTRYASRGPDDLLKQADAFIRARDVQDYWRDDMPDLDSCGLCHARRPYHAGGEYWLIGGVEMFCCPDCSLALDISGYADESRRSVPYARGHQWTHATKIEERREEG